MDLRFSDLAGLRKALDSGMVSAVELARITWRRLPKTSMGAVLAVNPEASLGPAPRAAQTQIDAHQAGPLTGLPCCTRIFLSPRDGRPRAGSKMLENYQSPFDAEVVERLSKAGMVTWARPLVTSSRWDRPTNIAPMALAPTPG